MADPQMNRRELLKVLIASGAGLGVAGFFQAKWTKPVVKVGVLPAHAQTSTLHTLVAGENGYLTCDNGDPSPVSTVTITPADAGISMHWVLTHTAAPVTSNPDDGAEGDVVTNSSGVASLATNAVSPEPGEGILTVTWTFTNPSDGTGSDDQVFENYGC